MATQGLEKEEGGWAEEKGGTDWCGLISLRRAGTRSLPCSNVSSHSILSPFVLQKYLSGWEREGESYSKRSDDRGSRWLFSSTKTTRSFIHVSTKYRSQRDVPLEGFSQAPQEELLSTLLYIINCLINNVVPVVSWYKSSLNRTQIFSTDLKLKWLVLWNTWRIDQDDQIYFAVDSFSSLGLTFVLSSTPSAP